MNNTIYTQNAYELGIQGQDLIEERLKKHGYTVFKKNFKKIGFEIDLIVYKFLEDLNTVVIHIVEVKTRKIKDMRFISQELDLSQFGIEGKWLRVRKVMFDFPDQIKRFLDKPDSKHVVTFDLAIVIASKVGCLNMHTYIQNVNLLL